MFSNTTLRQVRDIATVYAIALYDFHEEHNHERVSDLKLLDALINDLVADQTFDEHGRFHELVIETDMILFYLARQMREACEDFDPNTIEHQVKLLNNIYVTRDDIDRTILKQIEDNNVEF